MSPLITIFGIIFALYILAECVNLCVVGGSWIGGLFRMARQVLHGSKEVELPDTLKIAVSNGLLSVGSEVIVGTESQWEGGTVKRFAISPSVVDAKVGTIMQIIRLTRNKIELKPMDKYDCKPPKKNHSGEAAAYEDR